MDSLGYLITFAVIIIAMLVSLIIMKFTNSRLLFLFPVVLSLACLGMFGAYLYGIYFIPSADGIPITFFMRLFMLDDTVNRSNIQTGIITSLLLISICAIYVIVFALLYKRKTVAAQKIPA